MRKVQATGWGLGNKGWRVTGSPILVDSSITVNVIITTLLALVLLSALCASAEKLDMVLTLCHQLGDSHACEVPGTQCS